MNEAFRSDLEQMILQHRVVNYWRDRFSAEMALTSNLGPAFDVKEHYEKWYAFINDERLFPVGGRMCDSRPEMPPTLMGQKDVHEWARKFSDVIQLPVVVNL